jgi:hypothetical protein
MSFSAAIFQKSCAKDLAGTLSHLDSRTDGCLLPMRYQEERTSGSKNVRMSASRCFSLTFSLLSTDSSSSNLIAPLALGTNQ